MNRYLRAALHALPYLVFLVFIPYLILIRITPALENQITLYLSIGPSYLLHGVITFGLVLAVLSAIQGWANKWTVVKPVSLAMRRVTAYFLLLFLMGVGNPWTFGLTNITLNLGKSSPSLGSTTGSTVSFTIISTFFALMLGVALVLRVTQDFMKYVEDRRDHREFAVEGSQRG